MTAPSPADTIDLDLAFWGIRLVAPHKELSCTAWDFERTHAVICGIVKISGVEVAEMLLGTVVPAVLRDRENAEHLSKAPAELVPELQLNMTNARWTDIRVALESRMPHVREALAGAVAALADPRLLATALGDMRVGQGAGALPTPVLSSDGRLRRGIFARPQDVYAALLAAAMENLFPLDDGARQRRVSLPTSGLSLPAIRHWRAYSAQ